MADTTPMAGFDRRQVLLAAGGLGVVGALAACGGEDSDNGATEPEDAGDPGDDAQPEGDVLAVANEVPVGGGVINGDAQVVVTQPVEGEFKAFSSTCTHEGCQVAEVSDGLIRCFCHGSRYFIADGGVENGPATMELPEIGITVDDGQILRG